MVHETTRHTRDFTVISNRLLQHRHLGGVAIAVGCHMMSVAEGTSVTIRSLNERLGFSRQKIADALHALEEYGYVRRTVIRTAQGRLITQTTVYHNPNTPPPKPPPNPTPAPPPKPKPTPEPTPKPEPNPEPAPNPEPEPAPKPEPDPTPPPAPEPDPDPAPPPPPPPAPKPPSPPRPLPPVPHPGFPAGELLRSALLVLIGLRETDPRLYCSEADAAHLTPGVAAWLERGASPETIRHALTTDLPTPLRRPAALLAHRLATHLPPAPPLHPTEPPATPDPDPDSAPTPAPLPIHECLNCRAPFRSAQPAYCTECQATGHQIDPILRFSPGPTADEKTGVTAFPE
ncbi:helix-turn-helix domain-containing protein [Streptomyces sp. NPDC059201]|uniref:helix-turn-helix domain-containing protein n=1 Tax=Streptomyces sp. NPDC059201 TaxID=3346767 RepID=UPI0036990667